MSKTTTESKTNGAARTGRRYDESFKLDAVLESFRELTYPVGHRPHPAPGDPAAKRNSVGEVVLAGRLRDDIRWLSPGIPEEARATDKESLSVPESSAWRPNP